jgi:hypothetical protein
MLIFLNFVKDAPNSCEGDLEADSLPPTYDL